MVVPDGIPVADALDVVPHAVGVDDARTSGLGDAQHPAVDVGRDARHHPGRRRPQALGPGRADEVVVAADAARAHDDGPGPQLEVAHRRPAAGDPAGGVGRLEHRAADADGHPALDEQGVDLVPEREPDASGVRVGADAALERLHDAGPGAPRDVEARHGVAVPVGAPVPALGPPDDREDAVPHLVEPRALLARGEVEVRLGPAPRPVVLGAVELGAAEPVLAGQLERVLDAEAPLLGRIDEEQPAEAPEGLTAQALLALLLDEQDRPPGVGGLGCCDQPGEPGPDDDDVCVHPVSLVPSGPSCQRRRGTVAITDAGARPSGVASA